MSAAVLRAQLSYVLRRPRYASLPEELQDELSSFDPEPSAAAWLVHRRPNTGRTIVHEIDAGGHLLSVVKLGALTDHPLAHEATVLSALASHRSAGVRVAEVVAFARTSSRCALRTRLDLSGIVVPPYRWNDDTLVAARCAIHALHEQLEHVALPDASARPGGLRDTPSHGDFTPWNLFLASEREALVFAVIDYEAVGLWPASWDATRLLISACEERRLAADDVAHAARVLGVRSDDVARYIDMQVADPSQVIDARRREQFERYASLIAGKAS